MPVTVSVNALSLVHQGSDGIATASAPDVCLTPSSGGPVPVPYANVALSQTLAGGTATVRADGFSAAIKGSHFATSTGDEAGTVGGVASGTHKGPAEFAAYSMDVKLEGANACRLTDPMTMNRNNTLCQAEAQGPVVAPPSDWDWVEIILEDSMKNPVPGAVFELDLPDGSTRKGRLDFRGRKRVSGIPKGNCSVRFPDIPDDSWGPS